MAISAEQRLELAFKLVQRTSWDKLTTEQVQVGIDDKGAFVGPEFEAFIQNGFRMQIVVASVAHLPVWQTVTIGKTSAAWLAELAAKGVEVTDWARDIMGKPAFAARTEEVEVELIRARPQDLGFTDPKNPPTTNQLIERAEALGFTVDEPQAGPAARAVADANDDFWVLTRPISDSDGDPGVWDVYCGDAEPCLNAFYALPGRQWGLESVIVLVRRKQLS